MVEAEEELPAHGDERRSNSVRWQLEGASIAQREREREREMGDSVGLLLLLLGGRGLV